MATAATALIARARRNIQHHFFSEDAVRPDRALSFEPSSSIEARQFERMRRRNIVREARPGQYWIDVVAYDVDLTARYRRVRIALLVVLLILAAVGILPAVVR